MFPGQGAQSVGMLDELASQHTLVEERFVQASDLLGTDLWQLVQQGPAEQLAQTEHTQPALLTASVVLWELWQARCDHQPDLLAGHSLGEYSALVCGGAMSFEDAVGLVRTRGALMQRAVPAGEGTMAAILGLQDDQVQAACAAVDGVVSAANYNAPGQVVIAGHTAAVEQAIEQCKQAGARRAMMLDVSAPFHTPLMAGIKEEFAQALDTCSLQMPQIPIVQNVGAVIAADVNDLRHNLIEQLAAPVQWTMCVQAMVERGVQQFVECGPGSVLAGMIKRISKVTPTLSIGGVSGLSEAQSLGA